MASLEIYGNCLIFHDFQFITVNQIKKNFIFNFYKISASTYLSVFDWKCGSFVTRFVHIFNRYTPTLLHAKSLQNQQISIVEIDLKFVVIATIIDRRHRHHYHHHDRSHNFRNNSKVEIELMALLKS